LNAPTNSYAASVAMLREAASAGGERVAERLADVHSLVGLDMAAVDRELARIAREGKSPGTEAAVHLLEAGGKRVRPTVVLLAASCFGEVTPAARELAAAAELVHLATLLHDDVLDDGQDRRGRPTSRRIWGNAVSVLAGDLLLTHALEKTAHAAPGPVLLDLFATLRRLVDGEVVQLRGRRRFDPSEDVYFQIVRDKTSSLFGWACRAGATVGGASPQEAAALGEFGARVGVAFQLVDDVLDYVGESAATGKALLGDLSEGKLTLPLIRMLVARPDLVADVEAVRAGDGEGATRIAAAVREAGVCDGVRARARDETAQALAALATVPPSAARDVLSAIATELTSRAA
jgi:octaprenyl-diphosphate synthase